MCRAMFMLKSANSVLRLRWIVLTRSLGVSLRTVDCRLGVVGKLSGMMAVIETGLMASVELFG